jgi:hypothetical protein
VGEELYFTSAILIAALGELALKAGIESFVGNFDSAMLRLYRRVGCEVQFTSDYFHLRSDCPKSQTRLQLLQADGALQSRLLVAQSCSLTSAFIMLLIVGLRHWPSLKLVDARRQLARHADNRLLANSSPTSSTTQFCAKPVSAVGIVFSFSVALPPEPRNSAFSIVRNHRCRKKRSRGPGEIPPPKQRRVRSNVDRKAGNNRASRSLHAQEIEAAVNTGKAFADAFPQEATGSGAPAVRIGPRYSNSGILLLFGTMPSSANRNSASVGGAPRPNQFLRWTSDAMVFRFRQENVPLAFVR